MKRRLLALAATCLATGPLAWPRSATAAGKKDAAAPKPEGDDQGDASGDAQGSETEGQTLSNPPSQKDSRGPPRPGGDNVAVPGVNESHTVVRGDTLWDLSQHYLGNPWYWPKVWSYNPQIANPHWIYPGNQVKFSTQGGPDQEAPAQVQTGTGDEEDTAEEDDSGVVTSSGRIGYVPPTNASFRQDGFVTDRELEESGQITRSFSEREMLDKLDKLYCRFKNTSDAKVGDRYFIYKTVREVHHPLSGGHYGYLTRIVGTAKIVGVENGIVTAVVDGSFDEIRRGDYLAPYSDKLSKAVAVKATTRKVEGVIIDSMNEEKELGQNQVVFIDRGRRDGIEEGNILEVTRRTDGLGPLTRRPGEAGYEDGRLPVEAVGRLLVVDTKEGASTCMILKSMRELSAGDRWTTVTTPGGEPQPVSLR
jgi:hypothetical protein